MNLSAPKNLTWIVAVVIGVLGLLAQLTGMTSETIAFWLVFLGFAVLAVATYIDGI